MALKPKVGLGQDFLSNLSKIPPAIQNKILKWAVRFQADPTASGINYESIKGARDKNLKSVRIDQDWRGLSSSRPRMISTFSCTWITTMMPTAGLKEERSPSIRLPALCSFSP